MDEENKITNDQREDANIDETNLAEPIPEEEVATEETITEEATLLSNDQEIAGPDISELNDGPTAIIEPNKQAKAAKKISAIYITIVAVLVVAVIGIVIYIATKKGSEPEDSTATVTEAVKDTNSESGDSSEANTDADSDTNTDDSNNLIPTFVAQNKTYDVSVELGQYKGLSVEYGSIEATEEDIDEALDAFAEENIDYDEVTEGVVADGDLVSVEYTGTVDGEVNDACSSELEEIRIGSGQTGIEGFEEGLIGANIGDTVTLNLTLPDDYNVAELSGKEVKFDIKINSVYVETTPEITDQFISDHTAYDTVEEYREFLSEQIREQKIKANDEQVRNNIISQIIETSSFTGNIDEEIADNASDNRSYYDSLAANYYGLESGAVLFQYLYNYDEAAYTEYLNAEAEYLVKYQYIIDAIAKAENLTLTEEEIQAGLEKIFVDEYGYETIDAAVEEIGQEEVDKIVNTTLLSENIMNLLIKNTNITNMPEGAFATDSEVYSDEDIEFDNPED